MSKAKDSPSSSAQQQVRPRVIVSGMRTTGKLHIGNYFGALVNWLKLQNEPNTICYFGLMDWHALTSMYKSAREIDELRREMFAEWLAWGVDFEKNVVFVQSRVPEHLELFTLFSMLTPMGWLERVPTWKDAEEEAKATDTHTLGRFAYPVLQAADIAVYKGTHVPVGQDQISHLEITREIIRRLNFIYANLSSQPLLPEPDPILTTTPWLPGTDGRKMSKSYGNVFLLTQETKEIQAAVRQMVTDPQRVRRNDPGRPDVCSVFRLHQIISTPEDVSWAETGCRSAGIGCGDCKQRLSMRIDEWMARPRERKKELLQDPARLDAMMNEGSLRAQKVAKATMNEIFETLKL